jgi:hypothetical protein
MSDQLSLPPRLGRLVLSEEEYEAQEAEFSQRGTLGPLVLQGLGPAVADAPTGKKRRSRKPKGEQEPVDGEKDATDDPPPDATEPQEDGDEDEGDDDDEQLPE